MRLGPKIEHHIVKAMLYSQSQNKLTLPYAWTKFE